MFHLKKGFDQKKLGIHSTRKGAATFCASGTLQPPSQASIDIRGGWSQGRIKDVYQHFQEAGDQYVGRTVVGLPRHDIKFSILPPHFKSTANQHFIKDCVQACFPTAPQTIYPIMKHALASLVFHQDYLRETLPAVF